MVKKIIFIIIALILNFNYSYAAIEIKDSSSEVLTNKTISEFYDMAEDMKNLGQGLEGTTVDVKMANNYEWAVVSYFSNSNYGTAGAGQNTGTQLTGTSHYSTNGNITGVMDWGKTYTFTAGIIESYASKTLTTVGGSSIINNAGTNRVDKFKRSLTYRDYTIAKTGWYGMPINEVYEDPNHPYSYRNGLFGFAGGSLRCR